MLCKTFPSIKPPTAILNYLFVGLGLEVVLLEVVLNQPLVIDSNQRKLALISKPKVDKKLIILAIKLKPMEPKHIILSKLVVVHTKPKVIRLRFQQVVKHTIKLELKELKRIKLSKQVIIRTKLKVILQRFLQQVVKHIKQVIKHIELVIRRTKLIELVIKRIRPIKPLTKVDELFISQLPNIQLSLKLFLKEYILHICPKKLKERTQSNIQLHNNL